KAYLVRRAERKGRTPDPAWRNYRTRWATLLSLVLVVSAFLALSLWPGMLAAYVIVFAGCIAMVVVVVALLWWRSRVIRAAMRLGQAGDTQGALQLIRSEIEAKGPSAHRMNVLGVMLGSHGNWQEALDAIEEAVCLGGASPLVLANKGFALWNLR